MTFHRLPQYPCRRGVRTCCTRADLTAQAYTHGVDAIEILEMLQNVSCLQARAQCHVRLSVARLSSKALSGRGHAYPAKIVNFTNRASVLMLRFSFCRGPAPISSSSTTSHPSSREDGDCSLHTATCRRRTARTTSHELQL